MTTSNRALGLPLLLVVLGLTTTACVTSPLNRGTLATKATQVTFQGFVGIPNAEIAVLARNNATNQFDIVGSTKADGAQPKTDALGIAWYPWITKLTLDSQYWFQAGNQLSVKVMATGAGDPLVTFDDGKQECWWTQLPKGGAAVVANCKSLESPVVTLTTPCGGAGQQCCNNQSCSFGKLCSSGQCSSSCGSLGNVCCSGKTCGSGMTCTGSNLCQFCGGSKQPCCSSNTCKNSGLVCKGGSCSACGVLDQICCAGNVCGSGAKCSGEICHCGALGQPCCAGSTCAAGASCQNGSCATPTSSCEPFGASCTSSTQCCPGNSCFTTSTGSKQCCKFLAPDKSCN